MSSKPLNAFLRLCDECGAFQNTLTLEVKSL